MKRWILVLGAATAIPVKSLSQQTGRLLVPAAAPTENIVVAYTQYDNGGNTSIAHDSENIFKWSGASPFRAEPYGYFKADGTEVPYIKRDRDLGQTFRFEGSSPKQWRSVTVRLGFGTNVVRQCMYGKKLSLQVFEVSGTPVVHNNGTDSTMRAFHGFPHNRKEVDITANRDDYFTGERYQHLAVFRGYVFPQPQDFGFSSNQTGTSPDHPQLKGRFLQFQFPEGSRLLLVPGKQYAFLILIDEVGDEQGFTLANNYSGSYPNGHAIRRDGNGMFPPHPAQPDKNFTDPANRAAMAAAHFPTRFAKRIRISPGTNGYPDVDTWRDLVFFIEAR